MKPRIPNRVEGATLNSQQRRRLAQMIDVIYSANPKRKAELNLGQAIRAFLMTVKRSGNRFIDRPFFRIDNGKGPVVVPSYATDVDGL